VRSSGRIPKEIPILLIGSDLDGRVFSEHTTTVLLSRHGAGILSRHKLSPEQELVLRWPEKNKEAEIRIVGHIGTQARSHTYGVAFFDPNVNFWEIDFPPISPLEMEMGQLPLVCSACHALEKIDDASIEADILATNNGVIRFCKRCGTSTLWKPASDAPAQTPPAATQESASAEAAPAASGQLALFSPPPEPVSAPEGSSNGNSQHIPPPNNSPVPPATCSPAPPAPSFYASTPPLPEALASSPVQSTAVLTMPPPDKPAAPRVNRRKHARIKVNYAACVRHPERGDDIVVCEDMSKGGLRFKSHKRYYAQSLIDVAAPYVQGQPAIFVPAQIVYVEELPEQQLYRYGVQYLKPTKPRDSF
jgi:hypothetical protein